METLFYIKNQNICCEIEYAPKFFNETFGAHHFWFTDYTWQNLNS